MCGIAGIIQLKSTDQVDKTLLTNINASMFKRGPDKSGFWYSKCERIGLAHNRLSFIDLHQRSDQPLEYLHGRYVITYNGEIYNYQVLRKNLIENGYQFNTRSDTEVLMALYDFKGAKMLDDLKGMFAFAIWDNQEEKLFAARDPFGIKPFYYAIIDNQFIFASQVKSISQQVEQQLTKSAAAWCGYLMYGSVPEPLTLFEQIRALDAGHSLTTDKSGDIKLNAYYCIYNEFQEIERSTPAKPNQQTIVDALSESVNRHLVADVPVGIFLSSGIDSNLIAYFANQEQHAGLAGFTIDFPEFNQQHTESTLAARAAKQYHLEHHVLSFDVDQQAEVLEQFFESMDQPTIDGLNVWMISKSVSEAGYKAVLSGLGGDEVFAGYPSFTDVPRFSKALKLMRTASKSDIVVKGLSKLSALPIFSHPKFSGFVNPSKHSFYQAYRLKRNVYLKQELELYFEYDFISQGIEKLENLESQTIQKLEYISNDYLKVAALEIDNYMKNQLLKDADWASMSHSLEMRVPFVDRDLIRVCSAQLMQIKQPQKLTIMKNMMTNFLPEFILNKAKTGFDTPVAHWLTHNPSLQSWKSREHLRQENTPWARRWSFEVGSRFIN